MRANDFRTWLLDQPSLPGPVQDLANDIRWDATFPRVESLDELRTHLLSYGASSAALQAAGDAWSLYEYI